MTVLDDILAGVREDLVERQARTGLAELQVPIYKLLAFTAVAFTVVTLRFHKRLD